MFENVKADIGRYVVTEDASGVNKFIYMFFTNPSLWVIISYRFGRWIRNEFNIFIIKSLLKLFTMPIHQILCLLTGIQIPFETKIGKGFYIGHYGMLVIHGDAVIGDYCDISAGVVIGTSGRGENRGIPLIGNYVYIGVGAKVIGKITIGNSAAIGANAVVTKDVPENAVVAGIPAKIINYNGSKDFIRY